MSASSSMCFLKGISVFTLGCFFFHSVICTRECNGISFWRRKWKKAKQASYSKKSQNKVSSRCWILNGLTLTSSLASVEDYSEIFRKMFRKLKSCTSLLEHLLEWTVLQLKSEIPQSASKPVLRLHSLLNKKVSFCQICFTSPDSKILFPNLTSAVHITFNTNNYTSRLSFCDVKGAERFYSWKDPVAISISTIMYFLGSSTQVSIPL